MNRKEFTNKLVEEICDEIRCMYFIERDDETINKEMMPQMFEKVKETFKDFICDYYYEGYLESEYKDLEEFYDYLKTCWKWGSNYILEGDYEDIIYDNLDDWKVFFKKRDILVDEDEEAFKAAE